MGDEGVDAGGWASTMGKTEEGRSTTGCGGGPEDFETKF